MLNHKNLFTLAKHVTVASLTGLMLAVPGAPLLAFAADGMLHNIRFDSNSRHFLIDTTGSVKATVNTLIIAGRKRVIIDLDNADIAEDLPRDAELLSALSARMSTVRNVTVNQYGGNGRPIVRVLLDLQGDPGAIRLIRNQGPQIELELNDYASVSGNYYNPPPVEPRVTTNPEPSVTSRPVAVSHPVKPVEINASREPVKRPERLSLAQPTVAAERLPVRPSEPETVSRSAYERSLQLQQDQKRQIEALQKSLRQAQGTTPSTTGNEAELVQLKRTLLNMNRQYDQLVMNNQSLTLQLKQAKQNVASELKVSDLKAELESVNLSNEQLRRDLKAANTQATQLQEQLTAATKSAVSPKSNELQPDDLQLADVKRSLVVLNQRYELLKADHDQQAEQMQQLTLEKVSLSQQLTQAQKDLAKAKPGSAKAQASETQLQALRQQLSQSQQAMSDSRQTMQTQNQEIADLRARINSVKTGMDEAFKAQISELEKSNTQKDAALVALRAQLSASLSSSAKASKTEPGAETLAQLSSLKSQVETLNRQIAEKNSQIQGLNQQVALATARPAVSTKQDLQQKDVRIMALEQALVQSRQQSDKQAAEAVVTAQTLAGLNSKLAQLQDEHQALSDAKAQILTLQAKLTQAPGPQNQDHDVQLTAAHQELAAIRLELDRLKAEQKAQASAASSAQVANAQQQETIARLTRENQQFNQQVQTLNGQLKQAQQQAELLSKTPTPAVQPEVLSALQIQVSSLQAKVTALTSQAEQAQRQLSQARTEATQAKVDLSQARTEIAKAQAEAAQAKGALKLAQATAAKVKPATTPIASGGSATLQKQVNDLNQQLSSLHRENDELKTALASKSSMANKSPVTNPNAEAAYLDAKAEMQAKRLSDALDKFKQALLLDPNNGRYVIDYSVALSEDLEYAEAIDVLRHYLQQNPLDRDAYNQLGKIYLLNDQADAANQAFMRAIPISTLNNYATSLKKLGKMGEAENVFKLALSLNPKDSEVLFNLGNLYNNQNKLEQARNKYLEALQIRPDFAEAHYNLGLILSKLGDNPNAVVHLERFLQLSPAARNAETIRAYIQKLKA